MSNNNKPYPDVALIVLKNAEDFHSDLFFPDDYRNRYSCCQVVGEEQHKNIAENLKIFEELERKSDNLKTIKLNIKCHGTDWNAPGTELYTIAGYNPVFIKSIKTYLQELKKFMLKHRHIKLYINNDICYGARIYLKNSKGEYGDLFEDYKNELNGVLDRVAVATVKGDSVFSMYPGAPNGLYEIANGRRRFDDGTKEDFIKSIAVDDKMKVLYCISWLLLYNYMKEKKVKIPQKDIHKYVFGLMGSILLPKLQQASRAKNFREYYHFNSKGEMQLFDENSEKAKAIKNHFLGIKKQKTKKIDKPISLKEYSDIVFSKAHLFRF